MGEVEFFSFDTIFYKKIETNYLFIITFNLYIMVKDYRDPEEEETIEELQEENQQLRLNLWSLNDRISGCEPSLRDYLRGRNWRAPEDEKNDSEDAPKTIEQLREENQQLRLDKRSLETRISGCEPSVIDYLRG